MDEPLPGGAGKTPFWTLKPVSGTAETALLETRGILEAAPGEEHKQTVKLTRALADLYSAWYAAEPDAGYDTKAAEWRAKLPPEPTSQPAG